jgi:hypothetical protein
VAGVNLRSRGELKAPSPEVPSASVAPSGGWRAVALLALVGVTGLIYYHSRDLRGELAFTRLIYLQELADRSPKRTDLSLVVAAAGNEADLVMSFTRHNPDALLEVAAILLDWGHDNRLDRNLRTRLVEKSVACAALATAQVPSDYLSWLSLARSYTRLGFWDEAEECLDQARRLVRHGGQVHMFQPLPKDQKTPRL